MKTKTLIIVLIFPYILFAQKDKIEKKRNQFESEKIAWITKKLDLSPKDAKIFWPVYNEFANAIRAINKEKKQNNIAHSIKNDNEVLIGKKIDNYIILEQKRLDIKKRFHAELKKILSNKQIAELYNAEIQFKKDILKRLRRKR